MRRRSLVTTAASGMLALVLLIALVKVAQVDMGQLIGLIAAARPLPVAALVLLTGVLVLLAAEKWRRVEQRVAPGAEHSLGLCFSFTAIGTAAGQVLPMQLATTLARSFGSQVVRGSGGVRGALATFFEQLFDVAVIALCALVSAYCVWVHDLAWWPAGAVTVIALGFVAIGPFVTGATATVVRLSTARVALGRRTARVGRALANSGLFDARLARRLFALSLLRFVVLWLIAIATTQSVGLNITSLQLAGALPLVALATAVAVTPGGIGVNEWTFAAALTALGVDFDTATQCALINRALVAIAAAIVGLAGLILGILAGRRGPAGPPGSHEPGIRAL